MKYIYNLIETEEKKFDLPIPINENWEWSFKDHVNQSVLYKNSIFKTGSNDSKPFKNITRPILNLQYRAEGFDVKDIVLYVEEQEKDFQSLLIRKKHEIWARENGEDEFIDKLVESYVDFGAALVKKTAKSIPEVVPLQRIAFCDQSDMLSGPICEKHFYSPTELREEAKGKKWENIDLVISKAEESRDVNNTRKVKTPGKHIEVYELHGVFPRYCLYDDYEDEDENDLVGQVHLCAFYKDENGDDVGISIFKGLEKESPYKLILRDEIYGRALGLGGAEEIFQDQIWANYGMIRMKQLLDAASKVLFKTTDVKFANRNKTDNLENGEILVVDDGKDINQLDTTPRSTQLFDRFVQDWEAHAQRMGGATEAIFGNTPPAGTPFKSLELQVAEAHSLHEYRKTKLANFLEVIYREWIIPRIAQDIINDTEFMAELDQDEMEFVANGLAKAESNKMLLRKILNGQEILPGESDTVKEGVKNSFFKGGNRRILKILKNELKNAPISVRVNIAGKQKDLAGKVDKLVNVLRFMLSTYNPQTGQFAVFSDPRMVKLFQEIMEASGLDPIAIDVPINNSLPTNQARQQPDMRALTDFAKASRESQIPTLSGKIKT